jgi:LEA14-like dessication related protein
MNRSCLYREPAAGPSRRAVVSLLSALPMGLLVGCAALPGREPLKVTLAGVEPLPGEGLELRLAMKLRLLNPNDSPIEYEGAFVDLAIRGSNFASGAIGDRGVVPRFGETILSIPVTVSAMSMLRQVLGFASGDVTKVDYKLRGKLSGGLLGTATFVDEGQVDLSALAQRAAGGGAGAPTPR